VVCLCSCFISPAFGFVFFRKKLCFSGRPFVWITARRSRLDLFKQGFTHRWFCIYLCLIDLGLGFHFFLAFPASDKAIAKACFGSVTTFLLVVNFPLPNSVITLLIFFWALVFISVQNLGCDCSRCVRCAIGS